MLFEYIIGWNRKLSTIWVNRNMAINVASTTQKFRPAPVAAAELYFRTRPRTVPMAAPIHGPT